MLEECKHLVEAINKVVKLSCFVAGAAANFMLNDFTAFRAAFHFESHVGFGAWTSFHD
jgi:hypothetical protein